MTSRRILIIDDEPDIREVAEMSLTAVGGWDVLTAPSGAAGIALAKEEQPDAILLDVMMPEMDGPTTFANLRSDPLTSDIPVILLTAKAPPLDRSDFDPGIDGLLSKPFNPLQLSNDIDAVLGSRP